MEISILLILYHDIILFQQYDCCYHIMDIYKDEEIILTINIENDEVRKDNIELKTFLFIILYCNNEITMKQ